MPQAKRGRDSDQPGFMKKPRTKEAKDELEAQVKEAAEAEAEPIKVLKAPATRKEREQVANYIQLRTRIHEGPLYAVLSDEYKSGKPGQSIKQTDPFRGMDSYTNRYLKPKRLIPKLNSRPHVLGFFPKELWSVLDPQNHKDISVVSKSKRKRINGENGELEDYDPDGLISYALSVDRKKTNEGVKKRIDAFGPDENQDDDTQDVEAEPEPEDDDFGEPELEGGDDYDAEAYFNDGGDDMDGGDDAAGDAGDYY